MNLLSYVMSIIDSLFMPVEKCDDTSWCVFGGGDARLEIIVKSGCGHLFVWRPKE